MHRRYAFVASRFERPLKPGRPQAVAFKPAPEGSVNCPQNSSLRSPRRRPRRSGRGAQGFSGFHSNPRVGNTTWPRQPRLVKVPAPQMRPCAAKRRSPTVVIPHPAHRRIATRRPLAAHMRTTSRPRARQRSASRGPHEGKTGSSCTFVIRPTGFGSQAQNPVHGMPLSRAGRLWFFLEASTES